MYYNTVIVTNICVDCAPSPFDADSNSYRKILRKDSIYDDDPVFRPGRTRAQSFTNDLNLIESTEY